MSRIEAENETRPANGPPARAGADLPLGHQKKIEAQIEATGSLTRPFRESNPERNRDLARIHILKADLRLTREQYEAVLWTVGRVESSARLDAHGRRQVIVHLEAQLGRPRRVEGTPPRTLAERPMLRKIAGLLADGAKPWAYAEALAARMCGKQALEFCSDADLRKIVGALAIDRRRRA